MTSNALALFARLKHDPDPQGRVSAKCEAVFPRDKRGTRLRGDLAQTTNQSAMMIHPIALWSPVNVLARHDESGGAWWGRETRHQVPAGSEHEHEQSDDGEQVDRSGVVTPGRDPGSDPRIDPVADFPAHCCRLPEGASHQRDQEISGSSRNPAGIAAKRTETRVR